MQAGRCLVGLAAFFLAGLAYSDSGAPIDLSRLSVSPIRSVPFFPSIVAAGLEGGIITGSVAHDSSDPPGKRNRGFAERQLRSDLRPGADGINVTVEKPAVTTRVFDRDNPPPELPELTDDEAAVCQSQFGASVKVSVRLAQNRSNRNTWTATIDGVDIGTRLSIVIWLPRGYSRKIKDHEEGHRRISERVYDDLGEATARRLAAEYAGKTISTSLPDRTYEARAQEVVRKATEDITSRWIDLVSRKAGRVNNDFDDLTDHGRNRLAVGKAIEQAFAEDAGRR
jgi:hypothetical protein